MAVNHEQRHSTVAGRRRRAADADGLSEIDRRREERDRGGAGLRRHLRGIGLQRVVERIEA